MGGKTMRRDFSFLAGISDVKIARSRISFRAAKIHGDGVENARQQTVSLDVENRIGPLSEPIVMIYL